MLAKIIPHSSLLLEVQQELATLIFAWNFEQIIKSLSTLTFGSGWIQWGVNAASHCHSQWRWWSDAFWVTLICSDHTHSCCAYFNLARTYITVSLQSVVLEVSLQSDRYALMQSKLLNLFAMGRNWSAIHSSSWFVSMAWSETQCTVLLIMVIDQEVVMQMNSWNFTNKELAIQLLNLHTWWSSFTSHWNPILSRHNCSFRTYGVPVFFSETERPIFRDSWSCELNWREAWKYKHPHHLK